MSPQLQEFCRQEGYPVPDYVGTDTQSEDNTLQQDKKQDNDAVAQFDLDRCSLLRKSQDAKSDAFDVIINFDDLQSVDMALEQKKARWPLIGGAEPATYSSDAVDARLPRL